MLNSYIVSMAIMAQAAVPVASTLVVRPCDLGEVYQFSRVECQIELNNTGDTALTVSGFKPMRSSDTIKQSSVEIPPKGIAHLNAVVVVRNESGLARFQFAFDTDESSHRRRNAEVRGVVVSALDQNAPTLDYGIVNSDSVSEKLSIELTSREIEDFRVLKILEKPQFVDASIGKDGRTISANYSENAPLGPRQADYVKVSVNTPNQPEAWIRLKAEVRGDVVAASNPYPFGLMRTSDRNERLIRLTSRSDKPFRIGEIDVERVRATVDADECMPISQSCKMLRVLVSKDQPTGQVGGVINVTLPDSDQILPILVWGMLLSPEVKVLDYDEEASKAQSRQVGSTSAASPAVDLKRALRQAVSVQEPQTIPGDGPLIKWAATNEQMVLGYAIYRSTKESGPFVRLNASTILAEGQDGNESRYAWRDTNAESGRSYWYYIGLINRDGTKAQLAEAQKIVAK